MKSARPSLTSVTDDFFFNGDAQGLEGTRRPTGTCVGLSSVMKFLVESSIPGIRIEVPAPGL